MIYIIFQNVGWIILLTNEKYVCMCVWMCAYERERDWVSGKAFWNSFNPYCVYNMTCDILFLEKNNQQHNKHWLRPLNIGLFKKLILYLKYYFKYT